MEIQLILENLSVIFANYYCFQTTDGIEYYCAIITFVFSKSGRLKDSGIPQMLFLDHCFHLEGGLLFPLFLYINLCVT